MKNSRFLMLAPFFAFLIISISIPIEKNGVDYKLVMEGLTSIEEEFLCSCSDDADWSYYTNLNGSGDIKFNITYSDLARNTYYDIRFYDCDGQLWDPTGWDFSNINGGTSCANGTISWQSGVNVFDDWDYYEIYLYVNNNPGITICQAEDIVYNPSTPCD